MWRPVRRVVPSCQTSAFQGRSIPIVCTDCMRGVPTLAAPKIEEIGWPQGESGSPSGPCMIDAREHAQALGFDGGFEPFHRLFRPVAAPQRDQSVRGQDSHFRSCTGGDCCFDVTVRLKFHGNSSPVWATVPVWTTVRLSQSHAQSQVPLRQGKEQIRRCLAIGHF